MNIKSLKIDEKMTEKEEQLLKTIELQNIMIESMLDILKHYQENFEPKVRKWRKQK